MKNLFKLSTELEGSLKL